MFSVLQWGKCEWSKQGWWGADAETGQSSDVVMQVVTWVLVRILYLSEMGLYLKHLCVLRQWRDLRMGMTWKSVRAFPGALTVVCFMFYKNSESVGVRIKTRTLWYWVIELDWMNSEGNDGTSWLFWNEGNVRCSVAHGYGNSRILTNGIKFQSVKCPFAPFFYLMAVYSVRSEKTCWCY